MSHRIRIQNQEAMILFLKKLGFERDEESNLSTVFKKVFKVSENQTVHIKADFKTAHMFMNFEFFLQTTEDVKDNQISLQKYSHTYTYQRYGINLFASNMFNIINNFDLTFAEHKDRVNEIILNKKIDEQKFLLYKKHLQFGYTYTNNAHKIEIQLPPNITEDKEYFLTIMQSPEFIKKLDELNNMIDTFCAIKNI